MIPNGPVPGAGYPRLELEGALPLRALAQARSAPDRHALRDRVLWAGLAALSLLGLYFSLCHVTASIVPDSDLADPVMLWQGVRAHGPGFLRSWYYNPDNYLLSLIPATSLALELFGPVPGMVVASAG